VLFILILIEVEADDHDLAPTTSFHPSSLQILLPHSSKVLQLDNNVPGPFYYCLNKKLKDVKSYKRDCCQYLQTLFLKDA
jgi:hypothetical protein